MQTSKKEAGKLGGIKTKLFHERLNKDKEATYLQSPVICKYCNKPHEYEKRNNKFCSSSCAVSVTNSLKKKIPCNCINCDIPISSKNSKYCSVNCQQDFQIKNKISDGSISARSIKRLLLKEHGEKCWCCGIKDWNTKKIIFELEHIDGNAYNNSIENLSILCPNCHSQTATYKAKNKGNGRGSRTAKAIKDNLLTSEIVE